MKNKIKKIAPNVWEIEKTGRMRVPGIVFASDILMQKIQLDKTIEQVTNVAQLPGIVEKSLAMSDAHQGYGFPIGGVAAFNSKEGIISPGGVGYDINCGVRLIRTGIEKALFLKKRKEILDDLYKAIPAGVGEKSEFKLNDLELRDVLENGLAWAVKKGYASKDDQSKTEDNGCIEGARADTLSQKSKARGRAQLGTLGSGNHFLELQEVDSILDAKISKAFGLVKGEIVVMIHSGSRGLGHQTASDYIQAMEKEYGFAHLPDRELACAPIDSPLGKQYRSAMAAAANFAFTNRQLMMHQVRRVFEKHFPKAKLELVYDIAHNIAKFEQHTINGKKQLLCVHRKGATRSLGPGNEALPRAYQKTGQPIFLPGSMGTYSYVLAGTKEAAAISFSSTAHGAGRVLSRSYATQHLSAEKIEKDLSRYGVLIKAGSKKGLVEEAPEAYKDVTEVARVSDELGIGKLVARLRPLAVVKG